MRSKGGICIDSKEAPRTFTTRLSVEVCHTASDQEKGKKNYYIHHSPELKHCVPPLLPKPIYLLVILLGWSLGRLHPSSHRASSSFGHGLSLIWSLEAVLSRRELPLGSAKPVP